MTGWEINGLGLYHIFENPKVDAFAIADAMAGDALGIQCLDAHTLRLAPALTTEESQLTHIITSLRNAFTGSGTGE